MFSLSKIVTLGVIIAAVWFGFRLIGRLDEARKRKVAAEKATGADRGDRGDRNRREGGSGRDDVVDLVRDERTGEFVARDKRDERS